MQVTQVKCTIFTSNTYLITNELSEDAWLIDVGEFESVLKYLDGKKGIKGVFITHHHYDHIYEINKLIRHFPSCMVFASEHGKAGLYSSKVNLSFYHNDPVVLQGKSVTVLKDNDTFHLFNGCELKVYETPGHDLSCLTYKIKNYLFTGDSFILGVDVVTKLRGGNKSISEISLKKIRQLIETNTIICPGHGNMVPHSEMTS